MAINLHYITHQSISARGELSCIDKLNGSFRAQQTTISGNIILNLSKILSHEWKPEFYHFTGELDIANIF